MLCCYILYYIILYYIILYYIILYYIISYHIISYHIISYIISYHIISYIIYHIISYHIISYHILYYIILYYIILYYIILYYIVSLLIVTSITITITTVMIIPCVLIKFVIGLITCYGLDGSWFEHPGAQDILHSLHPSRPPLGSIKPRVEWAPGSFSEVKRPELGAEHQPYYSAGIKNGWRHNSAAQCRTTYQLRHGAPEVWQIHGTRQTRCGHAVLASSLSSAV
jgi:hypothetical protein